MSSAPVGISSPVISRSARAMRRAIGTPRVRTPTSARSSTPLFRSTISWAIRVRVRPMRSASMTVVGMTPLCGLAGPRLKSRLIIPSVVGARRILDGAMEPGARFASPLTTSAMSPVSLAAQPVERGAVRDQAVPSVDRTEPPKPTRTSRTYTDPLRTDRALRTDELYSVRVSFYTRAFGPRSLLSTPNARTN